MDVETMVAEMHSGPEGPMDSSQNTAANDRDNRPTVSPARLTMEVAAAIHDRCCNDAGCDGAFEHLREAAVAVDVLTGHRPPRGRGRPRPPLADAA
jgi:hypothetical protein